MRLRNWVVVLATPMAWACSQNERSDPGCSDDEHLCPSSTMTANAVECNCQCQLPNIPLPGAKQTKYGDLSACLPPALNPATAGSAQKIALTAMKQGAFNQEVFKFCSETVADWLSLTIKSQAARFEQLPAGLACQPYRCTCDTDGAQLSDATCETQCPEETCDKASCEPILRQGNLLDFSSCTCTRTRACGAMAPDAAAPGVCRLRGAIFSRSSPSKENWHPPMHAALALLDPNTDRGIQNARGGTCLDDDRVE